MRVFIYGSCVARDALDPLIPDEVTILGYIARHSLLSDGSDASYKLPDTLELTSAFTERMVRNDWSGNQLKQIFSADADIDLLLWDLIDERHGVHWFPTGELVTRSIDLVKSKPAMEVIIEQTHVPFGSDEHFEGWAEKATNFVNDLMNAQLLEKTRIIRIDWAEVAIDGQVTPRSMGIRASEANILYERYYGHLADLGVKSIEVPTELVLAAPQHKWGIAPFHYIPEVYQLIRSQLGFTG